jgi:poly(glycerol-phosphate) alpha-glucosyltransferase
VFGPQLGSAKTNCFANAAAFVLPSRSEGLPMAILEAWSHALPVAMTRACNLPSGFAEGAAVEIELESDKLAAGLREFLLMPDEVRTGLGRQGRRLTTTVFSWDCVAQQMLAVYAWCLRQREAPATIRFA